MTDSDRIPKVLVVDDEPNIRELVQVALKFHGCSVTTAASGTDALRQAEAGQPDLIVLDLSMPIMNGLEAAETLKLNSPSTPIYILTAHGGPEVDRAARAAGVDAVFSKAGEDMDKMIATARTTFAKQKPRKRFAQQK